MRRQQLRRWALLQLPAGSDLHSSWQPLQPGVELVLTSHLHQWWKKGSQESEGRNTGLRTERRVRGRREGRRTGRGRRETERHVKTLKHEIRVSKKTTNTRFVSHHVSPLPSVIGSCLKDVHLLGWDCFSPSLFTTRYNPQCSGPVLLSASPHSSAVSPSLPSRQWTLDWFNSDCSLIINDCFGFSWSNSWPLTSPVGIHRWHQHSEGKVKVDEKSKRNANILFSISCHVY